VPPPSRPAKVDVSSPEFRSRLPLYAAAFYEQQTEVGAARASGMGEMGPGRARTGAVAQGGWVAADCSWAEEGQKRASGSSFWPARAGPWHDGAPMGPPSAPCDAQSHLFTRAPLLSPHLTHQVTELVKGQLWSSWAPKCLEVGSPTALPALVAASTALVAASTALVAHAACAWKPSFLWPHDAAVPRHTRRSLAAHVLPPLTRSPRFPH
jgi:hypothetical protein